MATCCSGARTASGLESKSLTNASAYDDFDSASIETLIGRETISSTTMTTKKAFEELRQSVHQLLFNQALYCKPDQLVLTPGTQQALFILSQIDFPSKELRFCRTADLSPMKLRDWPGHWTPYWCVLILKNWKTVQIWENQFFIPFLASSPRSFLVFWSGKWLVFLGSSKPVRCCIWGWLFRGPRS